MVDAERGGFTRVKPAHLARRPRYIFRPVAVQDGGDTDRVAFAGIYLNVDLNGHDFVALAWRFAGFAAAVDSACLP